MPRRKVLRRRQKKEGFSGGAARGSAGGVVRGSAGGVARGFRGAVWVVGGAGYVACAVLLGVWLANGWLPPATQPTALPVHEALPSTPPAPLSLAVEETVEGTLEPPALSMQAVATAPYDQLEEANATAQYLRTRGAAGYLLEEDEAYRVLLSGYAGVEAARSVAERLNGENGLRLETIALEAAPPALTVTTGAARMEKLRVSFTAFAETLQGLDALWRALDAGETQATDAIARAEALAMALEERRQAAFDGVLLEGDAQALSAWNGCLTTCVAYLKTLPAQSESPLAISAQIKYTYMACLERYQEYGQALRTL